MSTPAPEGIDPGLDAALRAFAQRPTVLVATDFDGVLAPFVLDPLDARPQEGTVETLTALAAMPGTHAAIVSGRDLETLTRLSGTEGSAIGRIGGHGAQTSRALTWHLDDDAAALLDRLPDLLAPLLADHPGVRLEHKPTAVVVHTRGLPAEQARAAEDAAEALGSSTDGLSVLRGKHVVELGVVHADKGSALRALAEELGADAVLYLGDDVTEEHAFEVMAPPDVSIKVGEGATAAAHRVSGPSKVPAVLDRVRELRAR